MERERENRRATGGIGGDIGYLIDRFTPPPAPPPTSPPADPLKPVPDRAATVLQRAAERLMADCLSDPHWRAAWQRHHDRGDAGRGREFALRPLWVYLDVAQARAEAGDLQGVLDACLDLWAVTSVTA